MWCDLLIIHKRTLLLLKSLSQAIFRHKRGGSAHNKTHAIGNPHACVLYICLYRNRSAVLLPKFRNLDSFWIVFQETCEIIRIKKCRANQRKPVSPLCIHAESAYNHQCDTSRTSKPSPPTYPDRCHRPRLALR